MGRATRINLPNRLARMILHIGRIDSAMKPEVVSRCHEGSPTFVPGRRPTMDQLDVLSGLIQHSGLMSVDSAPEVQLQLQQPAAPRGQLLVLEDDPLQLQLLKQHLEAVGFRVATAASIREAEQQLADGMFQLAIFDVQLPDGSGLELCERLDSDPAYAGLPVIVLSSMTQASAIRQTRAAGGRYFLCKPYDPNVLLAIIERVIDDAAA